MLHYIHLQFCLLWYKPWRCKAAKYQGLHQSICIDTACNRFFSYAFGYLHCLFLWVKYNILLYLNIVMFVCTQISSSILFAFKMSFICKCNIWRIYIERSKSTSFTNTITIHAYIFPCMKYVCFIQIYKLNITKKVVISFSPLSNNAKMSRNGICIQQKEFCYGFVFHLGIIYISVK